MQMQDILSREGQTIYDSSGDKIGKMEGIYVDDDTQQPEWIGVDAGGFLSSKRVLVPVEGAQADRDGLKVAYMKDLVKDAPSIDSDEIGVDTEAELYEHYGMRHLMGHVRGSESEPRGQTAQPRQRQPEARQQRTSDEIVTHEEQLRTGVRDVPAGRVRLHKYVETRPVEEQVRLRQETAHIEREEINRPASDAEFGEQQVDMELKRQEPVVSKETVAKERVGLRKETEETTQNIRDEVRSERVEVEGDVEQSGRRPHERNRGDDPFQRGS